MDVKLKEGNILGITKFKLFLPTTREYDNVIFITALLEELMIYIKLQKPL